jgi:hypothetical protein
MNKLKKLGIPILLLLVVGLLGLVVFLVVKLALFITVAVCCYLLTEMIVRLKEVSVDARPKKVSGRKKTFVPGFSDVIKFP